MKLQHCFSILALTACLSDSVQANDDAKKDTPSCGTDYPADFPCIVGSRPLKGIEGLPNLQTMHVLRYETSPKAIAERIETEAASAGWALTKREVGMEPEGPRYRFSFAKAGVTVHASAYQSAGLTVLMVVTLKESQ